MSANTEKMAGLVLDAAARRVSIEPFSDQLKGFSLADAYAVARHVVEKRLRRGERPLGWKIGFTNTTIWDEYDVHAPIWGPVYDSTVRALGTGNEAACSLADLLEPRIEPEIMFRLGRPPGPAMEEPEILDCVDAVAHGFEIVQSLFPGWRFKAADTIAAFALHGKLRHGPFVPIETQPAGDWLNQLATFDITLFRDGEFVDRGEAANVLGGPLSALKHFVRGQAEHGLGLELRAGDLVTTGTVTRAFPIRPGETWHTEISGLPLPGARMVLT